MSQQQSDEVLTVYYDYVCPFCYLGLASLERYQSGREEPVEREWHPFDLRGNQRGPNGEIREDAADGKDDEYFEQVRENVAKLCERYDVEMNVEDAREVDSLRAQQAALYVREHHPERFDAFDEAVFEALWVDGHDIGDPDVLAEVAESVDIDGDEVREAVEDEGLRERLEAAFEEAREAGVTGVPTFVYEGHAARGAVPPEQLERLIEGA
jgi:predicted DsbA family dithiol-disulfide isomerase